MGKHRIAAIPGDGIGKEVIAAGEEVLTALAKQTSGLELSFTSFPWGSDYYMANGRMMPDGATDELKAFDAIYFGSAGDPRVPDHISLWQLRLAICQPFDQYANVRPTRVLPGITSPLRHVNDKELDWSSSARIPRASTLASAVASTRAHRSKPRPTSQCSRVPASSGSSASRSSWRSPGRASC